MVRWDRGSYRTLLMRWQMDATSGLMPQDDELHNIWRILARYGCWPQARNAAVMPSHATVECQPVDQPRYLEKLRNRNVSMRNQRGFLTGGAPVLVLTR